MREIKFRAWNRLNGKMYENVGYRNGLIFIDYDYDEYDFECEGDIIINSNYILDEDITEIMQYTGLKDKNGNEIYEGDIVEELNGERHPIVYEEYRFDVYGFYDTGYDIAGDGFSEGSDKFKVIGNIYENPELLK